MKYFIGKDMELHKMLGTMSLNRILFQTFCFTKADYSFQTVSILRVSKLSLYHKTGERKRGNTLATLRDTTTKFQLLSHSYS